MSGANFYEFNKKYVQTLSYFLIVAEKYILLSLLFYWPTGSVFPILSPMPFHCFHLLCNWHNFLASLRLIFKLINVISSVLQKLLKYFNSTAISLLLASLLPLLAKFDSKFDLINWFITCLLFLSVCVAASPAPLRFLQPVYTGCFTKTDPKF